MPGTSGGHRTSVQVPLLCQFRVRQEGPDGDRGLAWEGPGARVVPRGKGVAPVVQHLLGEVAGGGLDPEVAEHGIRLPSAQELDVVGVDAGAQQGGGSAGAKGAGAEEVRRDARGCRLYTSDAAD